MSEEKQFDVFLSYSRADKRSVTRLANMLKEAGIDCFLDMWNLRAGVSWQEALVLALKKSRSCAVVLGPTGPGPWTRMESELALQFHQADTTFTVIPVLLPKADRNSIPHFLANLTWVDFQRSLSDQEAFYQLTCAIRGEEPDVWKNFGPKDPFWSSLKDRAKAWERSERPEQLLLRGSHLDDFMKWSLENGHKLTTLTRTYLLLSYAHYHDETGEKDARQNAAALAAPKLRFLESLHAKPSAINAPVVRQNLTVLTRLAQRDPSATHFLEQLLEGRLEQLGELAIEVASETGDPLGLILADKIEKDATQEILLRILKALESHQDSVPLREVAVAATLKLLNIQQATWPRPNHHQQAEQAKLMEELGERLSKVGRWNEALNYSQQTVESYRVLSYEQPMTFSSDLSRSLVKLGERLFELGKNDEALAACQEAVAIARILLSNDNG